MAPLTCAVSVLTTPPQSYCSRFISSSSTIFGDTIHSFIVNNFAVVISISALWKLQEGNRTEKRCLTLILKVQCPLTSTNQVLSTLNVHLKYPDQQAPEEQEEEEEEPVYRFLCRLHFNEVFDAYTSYLMLVFKLYLLIYHFVYMSESFQLTQLYPSTC